jgi:hypothetical protein
VSTIRSRLRAAFAGRARRLCGFGGAVIVVLILA